MHIARLLEASADRYPDHLALVFEDRRWTYTQWLGRVRRFAQALGDLGVRPGDRVAFYVSTSENSVTTYFACQFLGAVAVPMNFRLSPGEAAYILQDSGARVLVYGRSLTENALKIEAQIRSVHDFIGCAYDRTNIPDGHHHFDTLAEETVDRDEPRPVPDGNAISSLVYTSGTTGVPKGAMLTHRNLVATALTCRDHFELDGASRIFGVAPLFHITGFEIQMIAAFVSGGAMVLTYRFQPQVALDAFLEWRPTFIVGAITAFIALMNQPAATGRHFGSFIHIYSGGAPIAPSVIDAFAARFGRAIRSSYGMTELTSASHLAPNDGRIPVDPESGALSIGKPTPGVDAIVVDDARRPLGPGEHGEVVVRGPGVMAGYWRKPAETDEVLTKGWLHSGDVGFFDADGWFYLVDRKKDMISASGFKVWPREVEDVIYAFPGVREAAVVGAADPYRGETVVAFVSAQPGAAIDVAALTRFCRERLAAYKCPAEICVLDDLPKTESGKITRNTLRDSLDRMR